MNTMASSFLKSVKRDLNFAEDNLHRAQHAAKSIDVNAQWGKSGFTLAELITQYTEQVATAGRIVQEMSKLQ